MVKTGADPFAETLAGADTGPIFGVVGDSLNADGVLEHLVASAAHHRLHHVEGEALGHLHCYGRRHRRRGLVDEFAKENVRRLS